LVADEIGKAEVAGQEDALERHTQAAIYGKDVLREEHEAVQEDTGGDGGGITAAAAPTFAVPVPADAPKGESKHAGKRAVVVGPTFAVPVPADAPKGKSKHAGKRAVVVGNGPSVVRGGGAKPLGAVIDSYDHVYRFNLFKTKGYEEHVGTKTTHWILSMIKKAADIDDDEVPAISKHLEEILVPLAFRECSNPAKGCPGLKPPKSAVKKMKDMLEEQKAWKDLPPNVKVSGEPPLLLLSPSFVPPTRLPLHPNHHITLRLQYRRDDD
jgi:hypothetical protein